MKRISKVLMLFVTCLVLLVVVACNNEQPKTTTTYELNKTELSLTVGDTETLTVTATPQESFTVVWESSNMAVVTVSSSGEVSAVAQGNANITASVNGTVLTCSVQVSAATPVVYTYKINKQETTINKGSTEQLTVTSTPAKTLQVDWVTSDTNVATVANGLVTAVGFGEATITASVDGEVLTCRVTVPTVYTYALSETSVSKYEGETAQLNVTVSPAKDITITWASSNAEVATVSENGVVTAVKAGTSTITATVDGKVLECSFTVLEPQYTYTVTTELTVGRGYTQTITAEVSPVKQFEVTYQSANTAVATVNEQGVVTGVTVGETTVTATIEGQDYTVQVHVVAAVTGEATFTQFGEDVDVNLTQDTIAYWEHYGTQADSKINATDVISNCTVEGSNGINNFGDYKVSFNWTNGSVNCAWIGSNHNGRCTGDTITFNIAIAAGTTTFDVYTGAWKATNITELYDGETLIAKAQEFTAGDSSINGKVTFTVLADEAKTLTVKITPKDKASAGNCSLVAVVVYGTQAAQAQAQVSATKVEMTDYHYNSINLTERGDIDWYAVNAENGNADYKNGGTAIDKSSFRIGASGDFGDYRAAFVWTNGSVNAVQPNDGDCKLGVNNGKCGDYGIFNVTVNANTKNITLWMGGYNNSEFYVEVIDANGNILLNEKMGTSPAGNSLAYEVNLAVTATTEQKLTVIFYRTTGSNVSLAAIAVSANTYTELTYTLSSTQLDLVSGSTQTLTVQSTSEATIIPQWESSNTAVATVDSNGVVTAVGAGEAQITAKVRGQVLTCTVKVSTYTLNETSILIQVDKTKQLTVQVSPEKELEGIVWASANEEIATVANGLVTAQASGQTTVTATVNGVTLTCTVEVFSDYIYTLNKTNVTLLLGQKMTEKLAITITPVKDDAVISWTSDNNEVATVDGNGLVTAVGEGSANITATADGFQYKAIISVFSSTFSQTVTSSAIENLNEAEPIYWEYYSDNQSGFDYMKNATDIIDASAVESANEGFSDYKLSINWTNGTKTSAWIGSGNTKGRCLKTETRINITVPAGLSIIGLYEGAWRATNVTELYDGETLIVKAQEFTAGESSVNTLVVFYVYATEQKTVTVVITPKDVGDSGNCSIVAISVVNENGLAKATTTASVTNKTEMTGFNDCHVNLTEKGTIDWYYLNYENEPDEKKDGTAIQPVYAVGGTFWDYKAAFNWTDGTKNETSKIDNDCNDQGTNNGYCGGYEAVDVRVDENTHKVTMWVGGYDNAEYYVEVIDSNGNIICNTRVGTAPAGDYSTAYEVEISITATKAETLTFVVYKTAGNNCSLAAVAVS